MGLSKKLKRIQEILNKFYKNLAEFQKEVLKVNDSQKHIVIILSALQRKGLITDEEIQAEYKRIQALAKRDAAGLKRRPDKPKDTGSVEGSSGDRQS